MNPTSNPQGYINFQAPAGYDPNYWTGQRGDRYNYANELANTGVKNFYNQFMNKSITELMKDNKVAVFSPARVDSFDFGRYLGLLPDFAVKHNLVEEAGELARSGNIFNLGRFLQPIGPTVKKVPYGKTYNAIINASDNRQQRFRLQVTQEMLDAYNDANSLPASNTVIPATAEALTFTANTNYLGELTNGCLSCVPNSCGRGYRSLYFVKNQYRPSAAGTPGIPQGTGSPLLVSEVALVLDTEMLAGGFKVILQRGANGTTYKDANNNIVYQPGSITLEVGDWIFIGTVIPTTTCDPSNFQCASIQPKMFKTCSSVRTFMDCIGCISMDRFKTEHPNDIMSTEEQIAYDVINNLKTFYNRVFNDFMLDDIRYAQNQPMPTHPSVPGIGTQLNGELVPAGHKGLLRQFDEVAREFEVVLSGDGLNSCVKYMLSTIMDALEAGKEGSSYVPAYTDPGWVMVGSIKPLAQMFASQDLNSFLPVSLEGAQQQRDMYAQTYQPGLGRDSGFSVMPASLFKDPGNGALKKLNNEFDMAKGTMGIEMYKVNIGRYSFRAIHDRMMDYLEPGVIRLMYIPDIEFITDDFDDRAAGVFGGKSPFSKATALEGRLLPSIRSFDAQTAMVNGMYVPQSYRNCPMSFHAYMRAGIHLNARSFPGLLKLRFVFCKENPLFGDPLHPTAPATIKTSIYESGIGCIKASRNVELALDTWGNGPIML